LGFITFYIHDPLTSSKKSESWVWVGYVTNFDLLTPISNKKEFSEIWHLQYVILHLILLSNFVCKKIKKTAWVDLEIYWKMTNFGLIFLDCSKALVECVVLKHENKMSSIFCKNIQNRNIELISIQNKVVHTVFRYKMVYPLKRFSNTKWFVLQKSFQIQNGSFFKKVFEYKMVYPQKGLF